MKTVHQLLFILVILTSCNRTIPCDKNELIPVLVGFSSTDLDTVVLKKYTKGNNFTQLIDSSIYLKKGIDSNRFYTFSDTTIIDFNTTCCTIENLTADYDWQLILVHKKYTVSISDVVSPQTEISCFMGKCNCVNPIKSMVQNGQPIIPTPFQYTRYYNVSGYVSYVKSGYAVFIK